MRAANPPPNVAKPRRFTVVARAVCDLGDGDVRTLHATRLSLLDMFILSVRPPPVGTEMMVTLHPVGLAPLPPLAVRVVSTVLDPADAGLCGFGAIMVSLADGEIEALVDALAALGLATSDRCAPRPAAERRQDPRVWADLQAQVAIPGASFAARATNLSMSGALICFGRGDVPPEISVGMIAVIDLIDEAAPERVSVCATVVRLVGADHPSGMGVRFAAMDHVAKARLEGLVFRVLGILP